MITLSDVDDDEDDDDDDDDNGIDDNADDNNKQSQFRIRCGFCLEKVMSYSLIYLYNCFTTDRLRHVLS